MAVDSGQAATERELMGDQPPDETKIYPTACSQQQLGNVGKRTLKSSRGEIDGMQYLLLVSKMEGH
jgi:hypothetical protein